MKVLKSGRGKQVWTMKVDCTGKGNNNEGCYAQLLIEAQDLVFMYCHPRNETDVYSTFRCPECGALTDVTDLPDFIKKEIKRLTDMKLKWTS